jgi:predicted ribosomally synthesized peptide with SipW-like signal peptide
MQLVAQLGPLDNIGGVVCMSGAAAAHPDVTNNPRFARYLWIDTQLLPTVIFKLYDGTGDTYAAWSSVTVADAGVTAAKLANYAVTILQSDEASSKIAYRYDAAADLTKAGYVLRIDAAGK